MQLGSLKALLPWRLRIRPAELIVTSFAGTIGVGTLLLMLPGTAYQQLSVVDALFTATSAVCVTGLIVVDTGTFFTPVGQTIILVLIQTGGIGIVTLSAYMFYLLGGRMPIQQREAALRTVAGGSGGALRTFLRDILVIILLIELAGALCLTACFSRTHPFGRSLYLGLFHAISAFCNAGFSLFTDSLVGYRADFFTNLIVIVLIISGGVGFAVLLELKSGMLRRRRWNGLSLYAKLVLLVSGILILLGWLLFLVAERGNVLSEMSCGEQILAALFQSVTARTAGFNTVSVGSLAVPTLFVLMILMFAGGASGSCAGGIKVNTVGVLAALFRGRTQGQSDVNLFRRRMSQNTVSRALSVAILSFILLQSVFMMLLFTELGGLPTDQSRGRSIELAFEAMSAFGTVGLSTGITSDLTSAGRLLITFLMFVGRVGPLTLTTVLRARRQSPLRYPEADLPIG